MSKLKKAILFGDYTNANWHPVTGIDRELSEILADEVEVVCTEEYGDFQRQDLEPYDLVITYADRWQDKTTPALVDAVLAFVSGGGGMLCLHNGIIVSDYELSQMFGGTFTGHPPFETLQFKVTSSTEHPIVEGVTDFSMGEEPYQFDFDAFTEKTILLKYQYEEKLWPAAWAQTFGKGRVAYLAPGHNVQVFQNPMFRRLVSNSARWALGHA